MSAVLGVLTGRRNMRYSNFTLAGVAEFSVSDGNLNGDSQPPIRALREPAVLKLRSPAKGVEINAVGFRRLCGGCDV